MMRTKSKTAKAGATERPNIITIDPMHPTDEQVRIIKEMCIDQQKTKKTKNLVCHFKAYSKWTKHQYVAFLPPEEVFEPVRSYIVQFTRDVDVYPHQVINPLALNEPGKKLLTLLLTAYAKKHRLETSDPKTGEPVDYYMPIESDNKKSVKLYLASLSNVLVQYHQNNHPENCRYTICEKTPFAEGGRAAIFKSTHKITLTKLANGNIDISCSPRKNILAVKQLFLPTTDRGQRKYHADGTLDRDEQNIALAREARLLKQLSFFQSSRAILTDNESSPTLLMPFAPGLNLDEVMTEHNDPASPFLFTTDQLISLTIMAAESIIKVHQKNIIHRDIKCGNMLLELNDKHDPVKLTILDVGISHQADEKPVDEFCGTLGYIAPELLSGEAPVTKQIDTYSFAYMLKDMIWNEQNNKLLGNSLSKDECAKINAIITRGLLKDPEQRATLQDFVSEFKALQEMRLSKEPLPTKQRISL